MMESYSVYKHTCPNSKVYIGITRCKVKDRWKNGLGYEYQVFGRAVRKYGWENITHEVLYENLTEDEAKRLEQELIKEFDSKNPADGSQPPSGGLHREEVFRPRSAHSGSDPGGQHRSDPRGR